MYKNNTTAVLVLILSPVFSLPVSAADPAAPAAISERAKKTLDYYEFQKRKLEPIEDAEDAVVNEELPESEPATESLKKIYVKKIVTNESEILAESELKELVEQYELRDISIAELFALIDEINLLYKEKSYLSAKAVLPPQKVTDGVIAIKLIEGRVGDVLIENNLSTNEAYITERISIEKGSMLKLDKLENDLFYFNTVNDIKVRALLKPGKHFATTDYILQVQEPARHTLTLFTDNTGTEQAGMERVGAIYSNKSVTGKRDSFASGINFSEGVNSVYFYYDRPVTKKGMRIKLSGDYNETKIIDGELDVLNIEGGSYNAGIQLLQPLIVERQHLVEGFLGFNEKNSYTDFDNFRVTDIDVRTSNIGISTRSYGNGSAFYTQHTITNGNYNASGSGQSFTKFNIDLTKVYFSEQDVTTILRASGQVSDADLLPASEQFQIGGISSVRGYRPGILSGDDGYFASAEINFSTSHAGSRGLIFIDHGGVYSYKGGNEDSSNPDTISSIGLGVNMSLFEKLTGRLVVAIPLSSDRERRTRQAQSFHFYFAYQAL